MDIDYAVSWDHPFPTAFEQSYAVVKWVFEQCSAWNADPKRISVGGHSAGGCLSAAIALRAAATRDFTLCMQLLDYSALDNYQAVLPDGNERSRRVIERLGFRPEGLRRLAARNFDGRDEDLMTYSMTRAEFERARGNPPFPAGREGVIL